MPLPTRSGQPSFGMGVDMARNTYIYIIEEVYGGFFKIGIADDVRARTMCLQIGNPRPLTPRYKRPLQDRKQAGTVERKVHKMLGEHRLYGEWFSCQFDEAIAAIEMALA